MFRLARELPVPFLAVTTEVIPWDNAIFIPAIGLLLHPFCFDIRDHHKFLTVFVDEI